MYDGELAFAQLNESFDLRHGQLNPFSIPEALQHNLAKQFVSMHSGPFEGPGIGHTGTPNAGHAR